MAEDLTVRRKRRRIRWWWFAIALPLLALGFWFAWITILEHRFEAGLEAIRAAHEPVDLAELNRPPMNPEDNAAPLLRRFLGWYEKHWPDDAWMDDTGFYSVDAKNRAAVRRWVQAGDAAFAWVKEAAARPGCDFGVDWGKGLDVDLPALSIMAGVGTTIQLRAQCAEGHAEHAVREIAILLDLARKMDEPTTIDYLTRLSEHEMAIRTLKAIAGLAGFDPVVTRALLEARLRAAEDPPGLRDVLLGERTVCLSLVRRWIAGEDPRSWLEPATNGGTGIYRQLNGWFIASFLRRPWACLDGLHAQEMFREGLEITALRPWEALAKGEAFRSRYALGAGSTHTTLWRNLFPKLWLERCRDLAKLRLARAGLALLAWRAEHGAWPATLEAVGKWIDPFTGEALIYEIEKGHARVSVRAPKPHGWKQEFVAGGLYEGEYPILWRLPK